MKLSSIIFVIAAVASQDDTITVGSKAKQKIKHLKANGPILLDLFFGPVASPSKPVRAAAFVEKYKHHLEKVNERLISAWGRCGSASKDPSFDPRLDVDVKFDHTDAFKGITGLTNGYKQWIEAQLNGHCKAQTRNQTYLKRIKLWAGIWKYKYCQIVNPLYAACSDEKHQSNPRNDGRNPLKELVDKLD